jgi:soluble lytic murein transglycosylase-like protein
VFLKPWGLCVVLAASLCAGESVVFTNGARMHVDRHEVQGTRVVLCTGGGSSEIDGSLIAGIEQDDAVAPAPAAPVAPVSAAAPVPKPEELADAAAEKYGLPKSLVRAVMAVESGFRAQAVSPKGAIGLMQLMPPTAKALGADPADPRQNVDAGTRYLRDLLERYDSGLWRALAAYNAGPNAVQKYHGVPPYAETLAYIQRVLEKFKR